MNLSQLLSPTRLTRVAPQLEDIRSFPDGYRGLARVPLTTAEDGDRLARVSARVTAGDILPDGARPFPKMEQPGTIEQITIANFKRSVVLGTDQLNLVARIVRNGGIPGEVESFGQWVGKKVAQNRRGNFIRMEQAVWGMFVDSFTYNFGGTQFTVTWNKPSDLKVTVGTGWATAGSATPVTDVQSLIQVGRDKYGIVYNRIEMSSATFVLMIATTQFQNIAKSALALPNGATLPPSIDNQSMRDLAARVLGVSEVLTFDQTIDTEGMDGTISTTRLLPTDLVLFSRTQDDGDDTVWQFNNGTVLESVCAAIAGQNTGGFVGGFDGIQRGPVSYAIADLASAKVEIIDVVRGFPGTGNPAATAYLDIAP